MIPSLPTELEGSMRCRSIFGERLDVLRAQVGAGSTAGNSTSKPPFSQVRCISTWVGPPAEPGGSPPPTTPWSPLWRCPTLAPARTACPYLCEPI